MAPKNNTAKNTANQSTRRLFLFAGYDRMGIVDDTALHYLSALSELGDIVFIMDNEATPDELDKLKTIPNLLHARAIRHGEYDFGSYKRAYMWAHENDILSKYDWVYLANDSVYGPFADISGILCDLESRGVDLTGMIDFQNKPTPIQVQSWFVGMSKRVATSDFIYDFMSSIVPQDTKQLVVLKYEVGLSQTILRHGYQMSTYISGQDGEICHSIYETPIAMLKLGLPFVKKTALQNLSGLQYLYPYTSELMVDQIHNNALRLGIPFVKSVAPPYKKCFRLTLFSVPLFTVYRQHHANHYWTCYKGYLFDFIPVGKIFRQN